MTATHKTDPHGRSRRSDPATSTAAAGSASAEVVNDVQRIVLELLRTKPMTDEELFKAFQFQAATGGRTASPARVRTARKELGARVVDSGAKRPTRYGRDAIVWAVAS